MILRALEGVRVCAEWNDKVSKSSRIIDFLWAVRRSRNASVSPLSHASRFWRRCPGQLATEVGIPCSSTGSSILETLTLRSRDDRTNAVSRPRLESRMPAN
jgi:hypothetical protein